MGQTGKFKLINFYLARPTQEFSVSKYWELCLTDSGDLLEVATAVEDLRDGDC